MTMSPSLRLLFVVKELHNAAGGAERVLSMVTAGLAERGHQVTVLSFDQAGSAPFYTFSAKVKRVQLGIGQSSESSTIGDIARRALALRRYVGRQRPDVAIGFMNSAFVPVGLGLLGTGVPIVASEHISYNHYSDRTVERLLLRLMNRLTNRMTVPTDQVRQGFPASFLSTMRTMPNPVDSLGATGGSAAASPNASRLLLAAGRLTRQKDFSTLINAFAKVAPEFPSWSVRIVGEGLLREQLEQQIAAFDLQDRIALPGIATNMADQYRRADVFIMSSLYESLGLVTAEALAGGVPVIGFADCFGTNALIKPGINGLLVNGADRVQALADGMRALMGDDELRARMAAAAPQSVAHLFGDAAVRQWDYMLDELIDEVWFGERPESGAASMATQPIA